MSTDALETSDIVKLGAADTLFFGRAFFPQTFRQASPAFHRDIVTEVENPENRFLAIKVHRDGAKTSLLRCIVAKRVSYGISRTILFVSASQGHAIRSVKWIKKQIMYNSLWTQTYGLAEGDKWTDEEITIRHNLLGINITIIAVGITGQVRGVNVDDFRPDFIVLDDPSDDENSGSPEQRQKLSGLVHGALVRSLAPASENPHAALVLLQTPIAGGDLIDTCERDPLFKCLTFGCFDVNGESRWPDRKDTKTLLEEKAAYVSRNQLSLWMREMECTIVSEEGRSFRHEWLIFHDVLPEEGYTLIGIDPTPPPRDAQEKNPNSKLDDACIIAIRVWKGKVFVIDYYVTKSPDPMEFINKIFEFVILYHPMKVGIETVLFARVLKTILEQEMHKRQHFFMLIPIEDKRKKSIRIRQALTGRASQRTLSVSRTHTALIEQFVAYPDVQHDDILDALSIAITLIDPYTEGVTIEGDYKREEEHIPALEYSGGCP